MLAALPPGVFTVIFPVTAAEGSNRSRWCHLENCSHPGRTSTVRRAVQIAVAPLRQNLGIRRRTSFDCAIEIVQVGVHLRMDQLLRTRKCERDRENGGRDSFGQSSHDGSSQLCVRSAEPAWGVAGCKVLVTGYCTVKLVAEAADPPLVVILIFPVTAPEGTIATIDVSEFTVNVAFTPPMVTAVA